MILKPSYCSITGCVRFLFLSPWVLSYLFCRMFYFPAGHRRSLCGRRRARAARPIGGRANRLRQGRRCSKGRVKRIFSIWFPRAYCELLAAEWRKMERGERCGRCPRPLHRPKVDGRVGRHYGSGACAAPAKSSSVSEQRSTR